MLKEFKEFALKRQCFRLSYCCVVMGAAFNKIVTS